VNAPIGMSANQNAATAKAIIQRTALNVPVTLNTLKAIKDDENHNKGPTISHSTLMNSQHTIDKKYQDISTSMNQEIQLKETFQPILKL
jgi:hypothetical protein